MNKDYSGSDKIVPDGWRLIRLENVIREARAGFACGDRADDGVIQLRMNNVDRTGNLNFENFLRVPADQETISKYKLSSGDVLFNNTNSTELVGKSALFSRHSEDVVFSNHFTRLRTNRNELIPGYLALWLRYLWIQRIFEDLCNRWIGQSAVKNDKLLALEIPLPSLVEQERISSVINSKFRLLDRARTAAEAQLAAAKALPAAYLREVFENPDARKWPMKKLGEISDLVSGGTPPRGNHEFFAGNIPWVKTLDLNCAIVKQTEECISHEAFKIIRGRMLPVRTVMVAMYGGSGTIGKSGILGIEAVTNQAICSLLPNPCIFSSEFIHYYLVFIRAEWMKHSSGNRRDPNINKSTVSQMECPVPSVLVQERISNYLSEKIIQAEILAKDIDMQLRLINKMNESLLRQAFNGEL